MVMKAYESYKNTDQFWLKQIPSHWDVNKIKYVFDERSEKGHPEEPLLVASQNMGVVPKSVYGNRTVEAMKGLDALKLVKVGDFVISLRSFQGGIEYAYYQGIISPAYTVMILKGCVTHEYFRHLAKSDAFIKLLKLCVTGIREGQNINYALLKNYRIPVPPKEEQEQIVRYLDWQNSRLNKLINAKKKEIALLEEQKQALISQAVTKGLDPQRPLKDSGIDWIGQIPEHWEIKRIKNLFSLRDERNYRPLNEVNLLSLYASKGVLEHSQIDKTRGNKASNADNYKLVYRDDIVVNIILCWMGAIGRSSFNGVTSPAYDVYKPNNGVNCNYYHHYFRMKNFSGECYKVGRGIMDVRWRTYSEDFTNIKVLTPPVNEQSKVAEYAEKISGHTNKLIEVLTHYVSLLQEYRTRLVADVVTGQIDVRHINIPNYETVTETIDQPETNEDDSAISAEDQ